MLNPSIKTQPHLQNPSAEKEIFLDLTQLKQILVSFWRLIALSILLSMFIAFMLTLIIPKKWEASATLQIGHIPAMTGSTQIDTSKLIEDPAQTIERIKLRGFKGKILADLGLPIEENINNRTDLLINSLKGDALKGTDFLNLSARGYSKDDAQNTLITTIKEIEKIHTSITEPIKTRAIKDLSDTNSQFNIANAALLKVNAAIASQVNNSFPASVVAIDLLGARQAEVNSLNFKRIQLETLIHATDEYSTKVINTIYVTKHAVFPKKSTFLILGAILGTLLGIGLALIKSKQT
jgi:uncharacterized protein involved in exopolysaccharide biosynthesis